jgi:DNA-directed RNA polymerase subunit omega
MNSELVNEALKKVPSHYVLVNMVSRRVRQLTADGGRISRPLVLNTENLGAADIALREIIEDKMGYEMPKLVKLTRPTAHNRNRPQGWLKHKTGFDKMAA